MAAAAALHLELETLVLDACHHGGLAGADGCDNAGVRLLACTQERGGGELRGCLAPSLAAVAER